MLARRSTRPAVLVTVGTLLAATLTLSGAAHAVDPVPVPVPVDPPDGVVVTAAESGVVDMSADGRWVVHTGRRGAAYGLFLTDRITGESRTLLTRDEPVGGPSISADGNRVAYVLGDPGVARDGDAQVWVHDRATGTDTLVSSTPTGAVGNATSWEPELSEDGEVVAFTTHTTNLVLGTEGAGSDVVVKELATGAVELVSGAHPTADSDSPSVSADGDRVAFVTDRAMTPQDTDSSTDVVVRTRSTGAVVLASPTADAGYASEPAISADGRRVAHLVAEGGRPELVVSGVLVTDLASGAVVRASVGERGDTRSPGIAPAISADGRFVLFTALASAAGHGDRAVEAYVRDLALGTTRWVSTGGPASAFAAAGAAVSGSGRHVTFTAHEGGALTVWTSDLGEPELFPWPFPGPSPDPDPDPAPAPVAVAPPTVERVARGVGYVLRVARAGVWATDEVVGRTHQWLRDGEPIPGAVGTQYAVTRADRGARLSVREDVTTASLATAVAESASVRVQRAGSRAGVRVRRPAGRSGRLVLGIRLAHDWGLRPQGRLVVRWGARTKVVHVAGQERVRVRLAPGRAGRRTLVVRHRGTEWVKPARAVRKGIRVRR